MTANNIFIIYVISPFTLFICMDNVLAIHPIINPYASTINNNRKIQSQTQLKLFEIENNTVQIDSVQRNTGRQTAHKAI